MPAIKDSQRLSCQSSLGSVFIQKIHNCSLLYSGTKFQRLKFLMNYLCVTFPSMVNIPDSLDDQRITSIEPKSANCATLYDIQRYGVWGRGERRILLKASKMNLKRNKNKLGAILSGGRTQSALYAKLQPRAIYIRKK